MSINWVEGDWFLIDSLERKRDIHYFKAWNKFGAEVYRLATANGRLDAHDSIRNAVAEVIGLPKNDGRNNQMDAYEAYQVMANHLSRLVVDDLTHRTNVNEPLVSLYTAGVWPVGVVDNDFILFTSRPPRILAHRIASKQDFQSQFRKFEKVPSNPWWTGYERAKRNLQGVDEETFHRIIEAHQVFIQTSGLRGLKANFCARSMSGCSFANLDLSGAKFSGAIIDGSFLRGTKLCFAEFVRTSMVGVDLAYADLTGADLRGADFRNSVLGSTMFKAVNMAETDLNNCIVNATSFIGTDLSACFGIESLQFEGPCIVDVNTLTLSKGRIPLSFLKYCDVLEYVTEFLFRFCRL